MDVRAAAGRAILALRLALVLPLVCVLLVGSLWLGQELRLFRAGGSTPTPDPTTDAAGALAAAPPAPAMQTLEITAAVPQSVVPSPDGSLLVGRTPDYAQLALLRVVSDPTAVRLRTELVRTYKDLAFVAWLPGGTSFVAGGQTILVPAPGTKPQLKTYDVFVVDVQGTQRPIGAALGGPFALSADGKWVATFDGEAHAILLATDGSGARPLADPVAGAPALLGWDAQGAIWRSDYRDPFSVWRIPTAGGAPTRITPQGLTSVSNARWSPDRAAAIVTVSTPSERDGVLTERGLADLPAGALGAWVGPHALLTRAADEHAGTVDVLTGARTQLGAKLRSEKIRVLAVSLPYVLWLDAAQQRPHLLDLAGDRDTGLGVNPVPDRAQPLSRGRFLVWRDKEVLVLDGAGWWATVPPTPSPVASAKDQTGVPAGYVRITHPEGGWTVIVPKDWYRRTIEMRGSDFTSYDTMGMDYSGNQPPPGEVRVTVQVMPDRGIADLRKFAEEEYLKAGFSKLSERDVNATLAGNATRSAYTMDVQVYPPSPPGVDGRYRARYWFERSPYFSDRVVVIMARPAEAHETEVERLMESLAFQKPVVVQQTPLTRAEVTAKYRPDTIYRRIDTIEAKLVRWKDYEDAAGSGHSYTNDPDQLIWVVLITGEIAVPMFGPISRPSAPPLMPYVVNVVDAVSGFVHGINTSGAGPRPSWFDGLTDLAKQRP